MLPTQGSCSQGFSSSVFDIVESIGWEFLLYHTEDGNSVGVGLIFSSLYLRWKVILFPVVA